MKPWSQEELLEIAKAELAADVAQLRFDGHRIIGKHGLVSADLKTQKLFFYRTPGDRPFCVSKIPTSGNGLTKILMHPVLRGWGSMDGMDDLVSVLFAALDTDLAKPINLRAIKLSKEAAKYLEDLEI